MIAISWDRQKWPGLARERNNTEFPENGRARSLLQAHPAFLAGFKLRQTQVTLCSFDTTQGLALFPSVEAPNQQEGPFRPRHAALERPMRRSSSFSRRLLSSQAAQRQQSPSETRSVPPPPLRPSSMLPSDKVSTGTRKRPQRRRFDCGAALGRR